MAAMRQAPLTCSGHTRPVVHLAFSGFTSSGFYLISACKDGKPMLRDGQTGDWIGTFEGHKGAVWGVSLNSDATRAATGAADFCAKIWNAVTGDELHSLAHSHIVRSVDFSPDDELLLTGSNEKLLKIYNMDKLDATPDKLSGHTAAIRHALFLRDGKRIVSASDDKTIRYWDRDSGTEIQSISLGEIPNSVHLSEDGLTLTVSSGSSVTMWDTNTMSPTKLMEFKIPTHVLSAALHQDNKQFVCGGEDFKVYKYDYETGAELESFKGHFGPVHCVRFSPDGELYASGSEDGTVRLWQTSVGKTYGLWKCVQPTEENSNLNNENNLSEIIAS